MDYPHKHDNRNLIAAAILGLLLCAFARGQTLGPPPPDQSAAQQAIAAAQQAAVVSSLQAGLVKGQYATTTADFAAKRAGMTAGDVAAVDADVDAALGYIGDASGFELLASAGMTQAKASFAAGNFADATAQANGAACLFFSGVFLNYGNAQTRLTDAMGVLASYK